MAATKKQYRGLAFPRRRTYFPHMMDCQRIADLFDRLGRIIHGLQFSAGLNPAQWEALRYLARANRYSRTPGALADFLGTTKGTASQTVIALESKGFISRARAANDRRSVQIDLTESGLDLMDRDPTELIADAAAELLPAEREALVRVMGRLVKSVRGAQGFVEFGPCLDCTHHCAEAEKDGAAGSRCALTGELLAAEDAARICVNFDSPA